MHHRRKRKRLLTWAPIVLAGLLIIAAFIIAPSLQPASPPIRSGTPNPLVTRLTPSAEARDGEDATGGTNGATPQPGALAERADSSPADARGSPRAGERRAPTAKETSTKQASTRAKRRRAPQPERKPGDPQDGAGASDLNVRWNQ